MGRWIILAGVVIIGIGLVVQFAPWLLGWFGKLPGDINLQTERTRIFLPLASMLIVSIFLTLLVNGLRALLNFLNR